METTALPESGTQAPPGPELQLLLEWETAEDRSRWHEAGGLSVVAHAVAVIVLLMLPKSAPPPSPEAQVRRVTPLVAPPALTQKAPNRGKVSNELNVQALAPRPAIRIPRSRRMLPIRPAPQPPGSRPLPEPPGLQAQANPPPQTLAQAPPPPPPRIQPEEKPKLAFESPAAASSPGAGTGRLTPPSSSVTEAIRGAVHEGASSGLSVGDAMAESPGINVQPSPGKSGSNLQLLSDPLGVDFKPYLLQILASVRRNWFAVMPESAHMGRRGKVQLQFAVDRTGNVVKLVYALHSGTDAFDRAAVAGISASNPFPPLPSEFKGNQVRLQLTFMYNIPLR